VVTFQASQFVPVALGFFGLGTGYLIWGPQELFGFPSRPAEESGARALDRATGVWGLFLPGLCQVVTGLILWVGLTWLQVFSDPPLYMAAVAFTAYGIHWFALGWNRFSGHDPRTNVGMSVAFTILSVTGAIVFFAAGAWPVGLLFCGLTGVYVADFVEGVGVGVARRWLGLLHVATGVWLMYLTFATLVDLGAGWNLPS
jgi:hypothetical protein